MIRLRSSRLRSDVVYSVYKPSNKAFCELKNESLLWKNKVEVTEDYGKLIFTQTNTQNEVELYWIPAIQLNY